MFDTNIEKQDYSGNNDTNTIRKSGDMGKQNAAKDDLNQEEGNIEDQINNGNHYCRTMTIVILEIIRHAIIALIATFGSKKWCKGRKEDQPCGGSHKQT